MSIDPPTRERIDRSFLDRDPPPPGPSRVEIGTAVLCGVFTVLFLEWLRWAF